MGRRVIEQLRPGEATPETFCAMLLQHADEMESIVCAVHWKEGSTAVFTTKMANIDVAWFRWVLDQDLRPIEVGDD